MAKRATIKTYSTADQKARMEAAARRAGLSVSKYLVKAGTQDTPQPRAEAQVRMLAKLKRGTQALERIAVASEAGGDLEAMLLLRCLNGLAAQLDEITDMIAEARR